MGTESSGRLSAGGSSSSLARLRERGVLRVAASYAVIAWLVLQIASVVFDPLGVPKWVMTALIIAAAVGFPIAIALAWFLEIGEHGVQLDTAADGVTRPTARGLRHYADAIIIGVLIVAVAVLLVRQSDFARPKPPANPAIAVLPFENLSGDPQQEYFADGLAEELLDRLGRVPGLRVIARSSSFTFKGKDVDARTVAERLGVTSLLEGSVRRDGRRLKLTARLIDGLTGQQTWSGSFDRELTDVFAVQAELAGAVVDAIIPAARGAVPSVVMAPTSDLKAYDLYLLSRAKLALRTPGSVSQSIDFGRQAVAADPQFARAYASLATSLLFYRFLGPEPTPEQDAALLREAESSVFRALALDPDLSEAHDAYANLLRETRKPGAEEEYKRAIELNPNNAAAWHDYSVYLGNSAHRLSESRRATERSLELDPRQPATWVNHLAATVEPGGERFRREFARALTMIGDMPAALDRLSLPGLAYLGYPIQIFQAGLIKRRLDSDDDLPQWLNDFRAWSLVDPQRARDVLPAHGDTRHGVDYDVIRPILHADATGLLQDWTALDRELADLRARKGAEERQIESIKAFWLAVQGRDAEAAQALALARPLAESRMPPAFGNDDTFGLIGTVEVRLLRASGRRDEAARIARDRLKNLRAEQQAQDGVCQWDGWVRYASLAANEGSREEAVKALQTAMSCGELPYQFQPIFPWFRSLAGYAPYDALLRERERRIQSIRAEMLRMEAAAGPVRASGTLQSPGSNG